MVAGRDSQGIAEFGDEETPHIFAEVVSVTVKPFGRDDYVAQLTIRLRPDNPAHPRSLLLELTDENDLLFYHSLVLGESDFHALRSEQRLLVDFQSFPEQLADLLRRCCKVQVGAASGRMVACLDSGSAGDSQFNIIESNHFRELTHIALKLRQGSDEVVKQHLATKLRASKAEASSCSERLALSTEALAQSRKQVEELSARSKIVAEERVHLEQSLEATHQRELSELRQEHARAVTELQHAASGERARLEDEHNQAYNAAIERAKTAENAVEELRQQRDSLTTSGGNCRNRLEETEMRLQKATTEVTELREQVQQLETTKFRHERELSDIKVQLASTKEQLAVREQHSSSQAVQIEEAVNQRRMLEESLSSARKQVQSLEEKFALSAQEIAKGNRIIQSLHNASKEAKAKLRLKASALVQQEKSMLELQKEEEMSKHVLGEKDHELSRGKEREGKLQQDTQELKKQLAEAHEVIKSNQEVIEYLNRQLTERDLKAIPGGNGAQDTGAHRVGAGNTSSLLADLLGRTEGLGQSAKKSLNSTTASAGHLGLGSTGFSSSYGFTSAAMSSPAPKQPDVGSSPLKSSLTGYVGSPSSPDNLLHGPVAYRRPTQALDMLTPTAVA
mmetsp:Transcript_70785/g.124902  ORF Transcript_70785/g.124902 Transcript_70785/m.124902 type:complete len:621 (+) Transcript_70785:80-1942(+)